MLHKDCSCIGLSYCSTWQLRAHFDLIAGFSERAKKQVNLRLTITLSLNQELINSHSYSCTSSESIELFSKSTRFDFREPFQVLTRCATPDFDAPSDQAVTISVRLAFNALAAVGSCLLERSIDCNRFCDIPDHDLFVGSPRQQTALVWAWSNVAMSNITAANSCD